MAMVLKAISVTEAADVPGIEAEIKTLEAAGYDLKSFRTSRTKDGHMLYLTFSPRRVFVSESARPSRKAMTLEEVKASLRELYH